MKKRLKALKPKVAPGRPIADRKVAAALKTKERKRGAWRVRERYPELRSRDTSYVGNMKVGRIYQQTFIDT